MSSSGALWLDRSLICSVFCDEGEEVASVTEDVEIAELENELKVVYVYALQLVEV